PTARRVPAARRAHICWRLPALAPGRTHHVTLLAQARAATGRVVNIAVADAGNTRAVRAARAVAVAGAARPPAYTGSAGSARSAGGIAKFWSKRLPGS
ncbi:hypothetical protein VSS74_30930, partial [Conexibacter stalactiti]